MLSSFRTAYLESQNRERDLRGRVDGLKAGLLDLRRRSIQYNIFQRDVDTNRQLYDGLLQRYKEIGVAGGVGSNNVSIVDPAITPEKPSSPRLLLNMLLASVIGMLVGAAVAYILEKSDEALQDPGGFERAVGLPLLGVVPQTRGRTPEEALFDRKSELVEAYLSVQTNLEFSTDHGIPRSFSVTSTRPSEGKSVTAFALATSLARAKHRVVLVDGDMRSPSVHTLVGIDNEMGVSNYLSGQENFAGSIVTMPVTGLHVLASGPTPPNAAELLTGHRFGKLIDDLLLEFDHVVVDSPPVMGLADAPLIASKVEAVVYAVKSHGIRSSLVRQALARLSSTSARVIGGVLTKHQAKRAHFRPRL